MKKFSVALRAILIALPIVFAAIGLVMSACDKSTQDPLSSTLPSANQTAGKTGEGASALAPSLSESSQRSGALHLTKECSAYTGAAGDFCTITSSNLKAIKVGSRVVYTSAADFSTGLLNSDLIIDAPGKNTAFGHVTLNLATGVGVVEFSGGTGDFSGFHARIAVSPLIAPSFAWEGTYWFSPPKEEDKDQRDRKH